MRVLKTAFNNPAGKKTSQPAKRKRTDRATVVKVLSVLNGEKFVQLPELPRSSIHRSPRPLGSLSNPSISTKLSHAYLCRPEQRFAKTRHTGHKNKVLSRPSINVWTHCVSKETDRTNKGCQ
ncbi:hypothetical protein AB205_0118640 [Aquarana catesbeiana]|uniref:Uncharacterized protein n=1 Tax=Aquarana catesbeiana TaxID=8400 RepID=A0A2G9S5V6_AQUCT|nr:hypothetical protein AB205_0118640 [Aquarana catesbeiana]